MHEERTEGVHIRPTGHKEQERDYRESDVEVVYRRGQWRNWDDVINWLETKGEQDNELTPGEVIAMTEDFRRPRQGGAQFINDPHQVFQMAHQHRKAA